MIKVIEEPGYPSAEELNDYYAYGYRYIVAGDYKENGTTEWSSGMPGYDQYYVLFDNEEEAQAYASTKKSPYGSEVKVKEIPPHTETNQEADIRYQKEQDAKKAKKFDAEARRAAAAGMSVQEYKRMMSNRSHRRRLEREVERCREELARAEAALKEFDETH